MASEIDLIIKIRDGAQMIADACAEWLEKQAPREEKPKEEPYNALPWEKREGKKGPFEMVTQKSCENLDLFTHLQNQLRANKGRLSLKDHYYWISQDEKVIFRRAKKK